MISETPSWSNIFQLHFVLISSVTLNCRFVSIFPPGLEASPARDSSPTLSLTLVPGTQLNPWMHGRACRFLAGLKKKEGGDAVRLTHTLAFRKGSLKRFLGTCMVLISFEVYSERIITTYKPMSSI